MSGSAGTESRWELKRMEGSEGFEPGQVNRRRGLVGVRWMTLEWRFGIELAKLVR